MPLRRVSTATIFATAGFIAIVLFGKVVFHVMQSTVVVPNGLYVRALVVGLLDALLAIGLVLVYRSNRIINFAQGELGAVAATLAAELYERFRVPYIFSVTAGLLTAVLISLFIEFAVIRRFGRAPRLILTVATIGVAQILSALEFVPLALNKNANRYNFRVGFNSPLSFHFRFGHVRFSGDHLVVLIIAPAVLVGLTLFFRYSRYGVAARGSAENEERARLLGVPVKRVSLIVWGMAGLLSGLTAILQAPILGFQFGALAGQGLLLRALAAAVIGRMESLTVTALAAVLLTMAEQTIFWSFGKSGPAEGFLVVVIIVALIAQRKSLGRVDPASSSWSAVQEIRPVPNELRRLPEVRWAFGGAAALLLAVLFALPFLLSAPKTSLASVIFIYAMVGVSLVMLTGWGGNVSLGQWAMAGVGALIGLRLASQPVPLDFFVILAICGLAGAAVSLAIGLPALRIRGLFLGVTTLGFAVAAYDWAFQWKSMSTAAAIQRPLLFGIWDTSSERVFYFVCLGALAFALYAGRNVRRSRLGRVLIATRDNEVQAQALGVRLTRSKLTTFALSGFMAALAGGLYAYHQQALRYDRFPPITSLLMFSMVVIGGMGSMTGAILGALYVRGIQYFLSAQLQLFATGFGLLILLLVFPGGLGQIFFSLRDRYLRRVATRRGVLVPSLVADRLADERIDTEAIFEATARTSAEELATTTGGSA